MAQKVVGSWSMAQLSWRLQQVEKTKQWDIFRRFMLVIVLVIWFTAVMTSVFFRLSSDTEIDASFMASATPGPLLHARKIAWVQRMHPPDANSIRTASGSIAPPAPEAADLRGGDFRLRSPADYSILNRPTSHD